MPRTAASKPDPFEEQANTPASVMGEDDPFESAAPAPTAKFPSMKQLGSGAEKRTATYARGKDNEVTRATTGRLLLLDPESVERNRPSNFEGNGPADRWTVRVIVLDGEPIEEVVDKDGDSVYTFPEPLVPPFELPGMYISQTLLAGQIDEKWDPATGKSRAMLLGRLMQLPPKNGRKPWVIASLDEGEADTARAYLKAHPKPDAFDA